MTDVRDANDPREPGRPRPVEWVEFGEIGQSPTTDEIGSGPPPGVTSGSRRRLVGLAVVAALVGLAVVASLLRHDDGHPSADRPSASRTAPTSTPSSASADPEVSPAPPGLGLTPRVRQVSPRLLGVDAGWELFGRGAGFVVRVQPAAGRITFTSVPGLASDGPVAFLTGEAGAIVRPLDEVPGYVVADGAPSAALGGLLRAGGMAVPGPDLRQIWVDNGDERSTSVVLTDFDGTPTGVRMVIPSTAIGPVSSDGDGYVLFSGIGGVYDVRPTGVERITTGTAVAAGGGRVLAIECSDEYRCSTVVLGLHDGSRRVLGAGFPPTYALGTIAPNGRWAAVPEQGRIDAVGLRLIDLTTGRSRSVSVVLSRVLLGDAGAWSPDSRYLFVLDAEGRVQVVDPVHGTLRPLGVALPALSQLSIRPPVASAG